VLGSPIVQLHIRSSTCTMVVVTSDGDFSVYSIVCDKPKLNYRGSILPAMQHLYLQQCSSVATTAQQQQPKLARIQITDSNHLMLILVLPLKSSGRLLSGFVYNLPMKLWMCISDTNDYVLSDLYSSLPSGAVPSLGGDGNGVGILAQMDRLVRSSASTVMSAKQMYQKVISSEGITGPTTNDVVTRSHCEDRLACSIALGSSTEFKQWLRYYARHLVSKGDEDALRFLVDIMLTESGLESTTSQPGNAPSFLSFGKETLGLNGKDLVRNIILPECLASRSLQRLTNEMSMELLLE
jgi:protein HIRA/HIR1